jgi:hypothetical protein
MEGRGRPSLHPFLGDAWMKALFLKSYGPFKVGQIAELPPLTFEKLNGNGIVELYVEKPKTKRLKGPRRHKMIESAEMEK